MFFSGIAMAETGQGRYSCYVTNQNSGRQVVVFDSATGNFDIYEIDNKALDRKENIEYYPCVHYDAQTKTRSVTMVREAE
jgi:hypothetical protein